MDTAITNTPVVLETLVPAQVFTPGGVDPIIARIRAEVTAEDIDISTPTGRKRCASLAYKVARSKTFLDDMGKKLVEGWKTSAKLVDAERDRVEAAEKAEQDRIAAEAAAQRREQEAAERERARIAAQQKAEADERARREKDVENRKAVNRAAVAALVSVTSIDDATARMVITAIAKGQVAGVSITY